MDGFDYMNVNQIARNLSTPWLLPRKVIGRMASLPIISDEAALKIQFRAVFGRQLNLDNPVTFNEKLQWLKLYDRNPLYTTLVDKAAMKDWAAARIGKDRLIPTLGIWEHFDDINFDNLPKRFVLKCTHDSGSVVICTDRDSFDIKAARKKLTRALRRDYSRLGREWPYKNVPRRIICEPFIGNLGNGDLPDYKFFCFNGEPKIMFVATGRQSMPEPYFDYFDMEFRRLGIRNEHPNSPVSNFDKPIEFELMKEFAATLSKGIPFVRVDFYDSCGKARLGELTFSHWSGLSSFDPEVWDERLGSWIILPRTRV